MKITTSVQIDKYGKKLLKSTLFMIIIISYIVFFKYIEHWIWEMKITTSVQIR